MTNVTVTSGQLVVDANGKNGFSGASGVSGTSGTNAVPIQAALSVNEQSGMLDLQITDGAQYAVPLTAPNAQVTLKAMGGNAGSGGHGVTGSQGHRGSDGSNANECHSGGDGTPGGDGGPGGPAGHGGNGGDGADISLTVAERDLDALMLVDLHNTGGLQGKGGVGGAGGKGGRGGSGGSSYSWTTYTYVTDSDGNMTTYSHSHHNSGGSSGSDGCDGPKGADGHHGVAGRDGVIRIHVPALGTFAKRYDVDLADRGTLVAPGGLFEPGMSLEIQPSVVNTQQMPTPRGIDMQIVSNQWIQFHPQNSVSIAEPMTLGVPNRIARPLQFKIASHHASIPAIDSTFHSTANITYQASLARVGRQFSAVSKHQTHLKLGFPIQMSVISHAKTITMQEEAPFAVIFRNISDRPIGINTESGRRSFFTFQPCLSGDNDKLSLLDRSSLSTLPFTQPYTEQLNLQPREAYCFAGTLRFTHPDLPAYTRVNMAITLYISEFSNPEQDLAIQKRHLPLQLSEQYCFDPNADIVLVTNHQTTQTTIDEWRALASSLGSHLSIWNVSLYDGISFTQKRYDGSNLISELKDKVVVILNQASRPIDTLFGEHDLLQAARAANIATYVVGGQFNLAKAISPPVHQADNPGVGALAADNTHIAVKKSYPKWSKPVYGDLVSKAEEHQLQQRKEHPNLRHRYAISFMPEKIRSGIVNEWQLGTIEVCPGMRADVSHIIHRKEHSGHVDRQDAYHVIKLLRFEKKLACFANPSYQSNYRDLLADAICADLIGELWAFSKTKWKGDVTKGTLSRQLSLLNSMIDAFSAFTPAGGETQLALFKNIMQQYHYALKRVVHTSDRFLLPWMKYRLMLSEIGESKLSVLFKQFFPKEKLDSQYKALHEKWGARSFKQLFREFSVVNSQSSEDIKEKVPSIVSRDTLPRSSLFAGRFTENVNFFQSKARRTQAMEDMQRGCYFDSP